APVSTAAPAAARPGPRPAAYQSQDFVVTFAQPGDTPETLAERYLGGADKAWMIEDYTGLRAFSPGQEIVIPRGPWNPSGVTPGGYQIVPILTYHNLAEQAKGRLVLAAASFREQMRYLKTNGYRVVSLADFVEFTRLGRQLPQRAVVLTFDDGYHAFKDFAYPVLKELGFTATLFIYTDWVGAGRGALSWNDLRELSAAGFDIQAHTKTHADLRRATGETEAQYARRMHAELEQPQELFNKNLGHRSQILAYPYGRWEEGLLPKVKEYGYIAAFSVRRQGNASFVRPLTGHRSQIYSEMTLDDFVRNLNVFQEENLR
ncbi:MAG TPA: polysaccharide deacetylase family protein, partial [Methylomirabilota bacterium]|nr:polysaccharide deacetylase family protein [Methylomirabilota bacterium]